MTEGLKAGWRRVKFGDVVKLNQETSKDPAADGLDRYVGLEHIEPGDLRIRSWGEIADGTTFTNRFRPGQVLFGKRRAYQRKVAVADFDGICSGDIYVLEARDPDVLLPELLPFLCQTDGFFEHAVATSAGSMSPRTNWTSLAEYKLTLPPMSEQRRITRLLRAFETIIEELESAEKAADLTRRSLLFDLFRPHRGTHDLFPAHWRVEEIQQAGDVQLGQQKHPKYQSGTNVRPYLRVANVMDGWLQLNDVLEMHFPESELVKFELRPGDILLNEGQSTELVGRSAIFRGEIPGCCFQKTLVRFRCTSDLLPEFAQAFFHHCLYTGQFAKTTVQTTSMAHLTAVRFKKMTIPVPPLIEQQRFVEALAASETAKQQIQLRRERTGLLKRQMLTEQLTA